MTISSRARAFISQCYASESSENFSGTEKAIISQIIYRMNSQLFNAVMTAGTSLIFLPVEFYLHYVLKQHAHWHVDNQLGQNLDLVQYDTRELYSAGRQEESESGRQVSVYPITNGNGHFYVVRFESCGKYSAGEFYIEKDQYEKLSLNADLLHRHIRAEFKNLAYLRVLERSFTSSLMCEFGGLAVALTILAFMQPLTLFMTLLTISALGAAGNLFGGLVHGYNASLFTTTCVKAEQKSTLLSLYRFFQYAAGRHQPRQLEKVEGKNPLPNSA